MCVCVSQVSAGPLYRNIEHEQCSGVLAPSLMHISAQRALQHPDNTHIAFQATDTQRTPSPYTNIHIRTTNIAHKCVISCPFSHPPRHPLANRTVVEALQIFVAFSKADRCMDQLPILTGAAGRSLSLLVDKCNADHLYRSHSLLVRLTEAAGLGEGLCSLTDGDASPEGKAGGDDATPMDAATESSETTLALGGSSSSAATPRAGGVVAGESASPQAILAHVALLLECAKERTLCEAAMQSASHVEEVAGTESHQIVQDIILLESEAGGSVRSKLGEADRALRALGRCNEAVSACLRPAEVAAGGGDVEAAFAAPPAFRVTTASTLDEEEEIVAGKEAADSSELNMASEEDREAAAEARIRSQLRETGDDREALSALMARREGALSSVLELKGDFRDKQAQWDLAKAVGYLGVAVDQTLSKSAHARRERDTAAIAALCRGTDALANALPGLLVDLCQMQEARHESMTQVRVLDVPSIPLWLGGVALIRNELGAAAKRGGPERGVRGGHGGIGDATVPCTTVH